MMLKFAPSLYLTWLLFLPLPSSSLARTLGLGVVLALGEQPLTVGAGAQARDFLSCRASPVRKGGDSSCRVTSAYTQCQP